MKTDLRILAYNYIKDKILNNEYVSDQIISEKMISDELSISKTPVKEAFLYLESDLRDFGRLCAGDHGIFRRGNKCSRMTVYKSSMCPKWIV